MSTPVEQVTPTICPSRGDHSAPTPDTLAYSLTLPSALTSPAIARVATPTVLAAHGLAALVNPATQIAAELTATACRFSAAAEVYVSLRFRDGTLRVIVYDSHPRHTHPRLAAACDVRRRAALRLLACVARACEGDWGFGEAREPGVGTRMWATVPYGGGVAYVQGA
ncbi:ATP-binding protein [Streptomyces sp. NPDC058284]|uniref:ATP-binding protein n=1 Tax=unclassified Streptomyces TaxID=2593676 RepID=UPI00365BB11B